MNEERFVESRLERWRELRALLEQAHIKGLRSLDGAAVRRLGALYRMATSDLATAKTLAYSAETLSHVNRLCAAAHDLVYARRPAGGRARLVHFVTHGFPALVRQTWTYHVFAMGVFLLSAIGAFVVFSADPVLADLTLGTSFRSRAEAAVELTGLHQRYLQVPDMLEPLFSWGLIANNVNVTLLAFALGCVLAVPAVFILIVNGVSIGGGVAVFYDVGVPEVLWTWMAAHGPIELTAIFIAAGAGMRVGLSPVFPGRVSRAAAFRDRGLESVRLLGGTALMLVVAGLLEGFVSPAQIPPWTKWSVAALSFVGMGFYFGLCGRAEPAAGAAG